MVSPTYYKETKIVLLCPFSNPFVSGKGGRGGLGREYFLLLHAIKRVKKSAWAQ